MANYLEVENISKHYGDRTLFENVSFNINEGDKIALVAPNGTGKTSLLKIIAGIDSSDGDGKIKFLKDISVAFLEQEQHYPEEKTIFQIVFENSGEKSRIIKEYEEATLSNDKKRLEKAIAAMDAADAWNYEQQISEILSTLRIRDMHRSAGSLSGGEKKRVALAAVLISHPELIVMDEPTNHLDLESIEYLENYLGRSRCTLLMVTHDRYFLDRVCNTILEMADGTLYRYNGNYSYFLEKREERITNFNAATEKAKNLLRTELDWIRRTPCARGTKARYRVNAFEDLKERASQHIKEQNIEIKAGMSRLGKKIINCKGLHYRWEDFIGVKDFSYNFAPGEKIGIIGKNGVGKSTFLNLLIGELQPTSGEIDRGTTLNIGYYKQSGIKFKEGQSVIEFVHEIADNITLADGKVISASSFLNYFLFPPSTHYSKIEKLSGGEKRRLYLLSILIANPNLLILDEPTNDLDILTLNVLEDYLKTFKGSVIIVSHDRFFLDKIVDHLFIFKGDGEIKDFPGSYSDYREYQKEAELAKHSQSKPQQGNTSSPNSKKEFVQKEGAAPAKRKLTYKEQRELEQLEKDLEQLSAEKKELEELLSSGNCTPEQLTKASTRIGEIITLTDEKEFRWLELSE